MSEPDGDKKGPAKEPKEQSVEALRAEIEELKSSLERSESRYRSLEVELHDLANLYVAASHLLGRLGPERAFSNLAELLSQLVGASSFVLYLPDAAGEGAVPCYAEGHTPSELSAVRPGEGLLGEAWQSGSLRLVRSAQGSADAPLAIVPLRLPAAAGAEAGEEREQIVGLLSITAFFEQKPAWADLDRELLGLLSKNAAAALLAAALHADAERRAESEGSPFDPRAALARLVAGGAERSD